MRHFFRMSSRRIYDPVMDKDFTLAYVKELVSKGTRVEYTDAESGIDLLPTLFKRTFKSNVSEENVLGPKEPINQIKKSPCKKCGAMTYNRFRCTLCLDKVKSLIDGDFIYYNESGEVENDEWYKKEGGR